MRATRPIAVLCLLLLTVAMTACGSTSGGTDSHANARSTYRPKLDRDNDGDNNDDDNQVLLYGQEATGAERQAIISLVTRYYTAAAASDGRAGCSLFIFFLAESFAEDYGNIPGLRGNTCGAVLSKLFAQNHALLAGERESLKFVAIRVGARRALVVMRFANLPEDRQFKLKQLRGRWWLLEARDGILE